MSDNEEDIGINKESTEKEEEQKYIQVREEDAYYVKEGEEYYTEEEEKELHVEEKYGM